jgi:hypothetical protein
MSFGDARLESAADHEYQTLAEFAAKNRGDRVGSRPWGHVGTGIGSSISASSPFISFVVPKSATGGAPGTVRIFVSAKMGLSPLTPHMAQKSV